LKFQENLYRNASDMNILKILLTTVILFTYASNSFAEEKRNCEAIDTSTGTGMYEKYKCNKGLPASEKKKKTSLKDKLKKLIKGNSK